MRKSKRRYNPTVGKLLFILPALIIIALVVYAYVQLNSPGTLIITAKSSSGSNLQVTATVDGKTGQTPWTLTLPQGNYAVNFTRLQWYYPPVARDISLGPGETAYAVMIYSPVIRTVSITQSGFNSTSVTALHGLTLVRWTNPTSFTVILEGGPLGTVPLGPGQTVTHTFATVGTYQVSIMSTNLNMSITVQ